MSAFTLAIANQTRSEVQILAIDFERGVIDFCDPLDGICRAPLGKIAGELPTNAELKAAVESVFSVL